MKILNKMMKFIALLLIILLQFIFIPPPKVFAATTRVELGTADTFAVLAGTGITNTGSTTISGDAGSSPTHTESGFGPGANSVTFTSGANHNSADPNDAATQQAKADLTTAYNDAAGRGATLTYPAIQDLGGKTLTSGVYNDSSSFGITGTLTLDAQNDADAVFIFQAGSTLTAETNSVVSLINGAQACNVFWQVGSSATIKTSSSFVGNILASESITLNTSATVNGRVLAQNGAVTMDTNTITKSTCATPTPTPTPTPTSTTTSSSSSGSGGSSSPGTIVYPPLSSTVIAPIIIESRRVDADSIFIGWGPYSGVDTFTVQYSPENGNWLYNTKITGFSTTINSLPPNQPIWVQIAANNGTIGTYGESKLVGGPILPNTGLGPYESNTPWYIPAGIFAGISVLLFIIQRKHDVHPDIEGLH